MSQKIVQLLTLRFVDVSRVGTGKVEEGAGSRMTQDDKGNDGLCHSNHEDPFRINFIKVIKVAPQLYSVVQKFWKFS